MPRINVRTNSYLPKQKQIAMVLEMKKVIDTIPWEDGKHLMADFADGCSMMFGDNPSLPCATVEINILEKVYLRVDESILEEALMQLTKIVNKHSKIPFDRIFAFFNPLPMWAWEGLNIEKTIINLDEPASERKESPFKMNPKHLSCKFM